MNRKKEVVSIAQSHIERGIAKYNGILDGQLVSLIKAAGLQYTPYIFSDGRILLVLPNNLGGFLYDDRGTLFESLSLTS